MKKIILGCFVFLFVLAGCASVGSFEKANTETVTYLQEGIASGQSFTVEFDMDTPYAVTGVMTVDGQNTTSTFTYKEVEYTLNDVDGKFDLCAGDKCNSDLPGNVGLAYEQLSAQYSGVLATALTAYVNTMLTDIATTSTGEYQNDGTETVEGVNYVIYPTQTGEIQKAGSNEDNTVLSIDYTYADGGHEADTIYLNS